eukprot:scaffold44714_cov66-Phaeocystis_antarctica.AAC.3
MTLNVPSASAQRLRSPEGILDRKRVTLPPSTRLTNSMQSRWKRADLNGPFSSLSPASSVSVTASAGMSKMTKMRAAKVCAT